MSEVTSKRKQEHLRSLPAVDELLRSESVVDESGDLPLSLVARAMREALDAVRERLLGDTSDPDTDVAKWAHDEAIVRLHRLRQSLLGRVINATGVVLHTNLGRAPLGEKAIDAVVAVARGYSNLEYDVPSGRRGLRDLHGETLLRALTGAEAAL